MLAVAEQISISKNKASAIIDEVVNTFRHFEDYVEEIVPEQMIDEIKRNLVLC